MKVYCGKCGHELTAGLRDVNDGVTIDYYCDFCDEWKVSIKVSLEKIGGILIDL